MTSADVGVWLLVLLCTVQFLYLVKQANTVHELKDQLAKRPIGRITEVSQDERGVVAKGQLFEGVVFPKSEMDALSIRFDDGAFEKQVSKSRDIIPLTLKYDSLREKDES